MFPRHDMHVAVPGGAPCPHCAQCSPKKPNYAPAGLYGCVKARAGPGKLWTLARVRGIARLCSGSRPEMRIWAAARPGPAKLRTPADSGHSSVYQI